MTAEGEHIEMLTPNEMVVLGLLGQVAREVDRIIGPGPLAEADLAEAVFHIHAVQNMILSQAAARAYPGEFRLLGDSA